MENRLRKLALAAAVVAAGTLGATALAHGPGFGSGAMGGYGPGMMGGYGPGMMDGGQRRGFGPGGGYGPGSGYGPGQGFGPGAGALASLNLSDEQRAKIQAIQEQHREQNWGRMGQMRSEMLKSRLEVRKQVESVLTEEQRKQFRQLRPWGPEGNG